MDNKPPGMPRRDLGKTGVRVSLLGFGGGSRFLVAGEDEAARMLERAVEAGVTYFDTAASYGRDRASERRYGAVLSRHRGKIFLATKTEQRTYDGALRSVEESLRLLKTDRLDLIQMHDVGPADDPAAWEKPTGALTALRKLQAQKVVRFIGFTGHQKARSTGTSSSASPSTPS
jgi:aryl-alcohol dehydrogenase-like predicted oxidoreductase